MARLTRLILGTLTGAFFIVGTTAPALAMPRGPDNQPITSGITAAPKAETYSVRAGDTLTTIGKSLDRSWQQLAGWNKLTEPNLILVGEILKIPTASYVPPPMPVLVSAPVFTHVAVKNVSKTYVSATSVGGWSWPWSCIARGESGGNPSDNTGNGYWGGLQFAPSTWWNFATKLGITVPAYQASIAQQEAVANLVLASGGWGQWPATSRACGF